LPLGDGSHAASCLRIIRDQRKSTPQLGDGGQLAALLHGTADGLGTRFIDGKHSARMGPPLPTSKPGVSWGSGRRSMLRIRRSSIKVAACVASITSVALLANSPGNSASHLIRRYRTSHPPGILRQPAPRPCCAAIRKPASAAWTFCAGGCSALDQGSRPRSRAGQRAVRHRQHVGHVPGSLSRAALPGAGGRMVRMAKAFRRAQGGPCLRIPGRAPWPLPAFGRACAGQTGRSSAPSPSSPRSPAPRRPRSIPRHLPAGEQHQRGELVCRQRKISGTFEQKWARMRAE
jgi:hypothetical protein